MLLYCQTMAEETTVTNTVQSTNTPPRAEQLSSDVLKLCALLAHIMMRRLSKQKGIHNVSSTLH
jgi:hypothetical protein